jgi:2-succinyl-6-hydroxy-2,4-cyclohexadiene-1-carboxylate synthase
VRLAYEVVGRGVPVTFLHGFSQGGAIWRETASLLPANRWSCLLLDLRGHGGTEAPPGSPVTLEACGADVLAAWDRLEIRRSHLVGYSMGGRLALHLASRRPERLLSLVVVGAHAGFEGRERAERRRQDEQLARRIETEGIEWFVDHWSSLPLFAGIARRGPQFQEALRAVRLRNRPEGLAASLRGMGAGATEPFWNRLIAISCPALFVAGEEDETYRRQAERLASSVASGRVAVVPGAGHAVHLEQPQAFARLLADHLSSL